MGNEIISAIYLMLLLHSQFCYTTDDIRQFQVSYHVSAVHSYSLCV